MGDCSCVIHPGETHTEHMRRLYTRMYWARAREICDGVAEVIAKSEAGQPITILSISHVDHRDDPTRYPTWDEIAHARDELLPTELGFVMHLPPAGQYVACHPTTFHLHEHPSREAHHGQ